MGRRCEPWGRCPKWTAGTVTQAGNPAGQRKCAAEEMERRAQVVGRETQWHPREHSDSRGSLSSRRNGV